MKLFSDSFTDGDFIAGDNAFAVIANPGHVALSRNRNPHLAWSDLPMGTRSFALAVIDYDVPSVGDAVNVVGLIVPVDLPRVAFTHWLLANLPEHVPEIEAGSFSDGIIARGKPAQGLHGSVQGLNDYTAWFAGDPQMSGQYHGYDGPCPPWNDERMHHYVFTLYALSVDRVDLPESFNAQQLQDAIAPYLLDQASMIGRYTLNPAVEF